MVAPNSPMDAREGEDHAGDKARRDQRQRDGEEDPGGVRAERAGGGFEPLVDALDGKPDRAHHQREAHDRAGQRRTRPAEREDDAEMLIEEGAHRPFPAEGDEQQIAGDDRRHHQRQMHDAVEQRLAPEVAPRQQHGDGQAEGQAADHGHGRDQEAKPDRGQFVGAQRPPAQCQRPPICCARGAQHKDESPLTLSLSREGRGDAWSAALASVCGMAAGPLSPCGRGEGGARGRATRGEGRETDVPDEQACKYNITSPQAP